jgi:arsenate reductase-like glutaredoxin family protein
MTLTMFHNPSCGTSPKVLDAIAARGLDVEVVAYLKTPPDAPDAPDAADAADDTTPDTVIIARPPTVAEAFLDSL